MTIVNMSELLKEAQNQGEKTGTYRGVGAFNVGNMEMILGVIKAAEETKTSIIMQIAEGRLPHSPLELMAPMMVAAAKQATVPVSVHFDHGKTLEKIRFALDAGFTSVMFDGSSLPFRDNIAKTREIAELAHSYGADAEGELGIVGGSETTKVAGAHGSEATKAVGANDSEATKEAGSHESVAGSGVTAEIQEGALNSVKNDASVSGETIAPEKSKDRSGVDTNIYTDPQEAKIFASETGIDALAVAIGNAHGEYKGIPKLNFDVLDSVRGEVSVPLVLHGGSGITDSDFQKAIQHGIRKVNIATASFNKLTARATEYLSSDGKKNYFSLNEAMVQGVYENVLHHIRVFNCDSSFPVI